jgi:glycerol transport system ATP-binding protein
VSLILENVSKTVGSETYIENVSLSLEGGSLNVLLGPTLSGKTSLMRLMAGLDKPTSGRVLVDGKDVTGAHVRTRSVAMVYQQFINYPTLTVYENIASPLRVAGHSREQIEREVREAARLLKLEPLLQRTPLELSGGQQQRTAIARAIVKRAALVLLDEPLANLDYKLREELREELPKLFAGRNCIVVYATTEPIEALLFGGNTATLHEGRVTQYGPTAHIYRHPRDIITARVFSDPPINTAPIVKQGNEILIGDSVRLPAGKVGAAIPDGSYDWGIRPHHITASGGRARLAPIEGRVLVTELSGSESIVHFDLGGRSWVSQSHGIHPFEVGSTARLYVDVDESFFFDKQGRLIAGGALG